MNFTKQISNNLIYILRELENVNNNNSETNHTLTPEEIHKQQLKDLYIYIAVLVAIIITILGGYALYRKYVEKKALDEIEREYQLMILNLLNSNSSQNSSSRENKKPHSYQINIQYLENEFGNQNMNNSFDFNHEERMEDIRRKFGNSIVIKCLLKKQIEEIQYAKNFAEEFGDICTICMENFIEHTLISKTPCEHVFHKTCFDTYLKGIKGKDKLLCPNCNQNLLINKKFLKLRNKAKKIEVKKEINNKKDIKESELNLESKNRYSVMTNKNEDYLQSNINEIIFVKKKLVKSEKSKISENRNIHIRDKSNNKINTIYNPLQIKIKENDSDTKIGKETILSYDNKIDKKDIKELDKMRKRNIVYINNYEKNNTSKNPLTSNESKGKLNLKKIKKTINEINPQKEIILSKKTFLQSISSLKQEK